jgi:hypothetical protein
MATITTVTTVTTIRRRFEIRWLVFTAALVCASSVPAFAQTVFVDGVAFVGVELRNGSDGQTSPGSGSSVDLNGTVAGGTIGVGTMLTPRLSARIEVGLPTTLDGTVDEGLILPAINSVLPPFTPFTLTREVWDRARTVSALLAYHTERDHRIQLAFIGGAAFVQRTIRQRVRYSFPLIDIPELAPWAIPRLGLTIPAELTDYTTTDYSVAVTAGVDADIAIGTRISVVPQVRVIGLDDGVSIRPGVGVRIKF